MQEIYQKTVSQNISFSGVGLHSGIVSKVRILPAKENSGIIFKRNDLEKNNIVPANYKNVSSARLCTTLTNEFGVSVSTVEHLMAAFYMTGIDNALVEVDSQEIPIMDGSSKDFMKLIVFSGARVQNNKKRFLKVVKKFDFKDENKTISIEPSNIGLCVDFQLNYKNELIGQQRNKVNFYNDDLTDIYSSRTFCLYEDIEAIKKHGLAKGGSLQNAIVVKKNEVLNEDGLRNEKEFVNHKILDLAGDFMLSGFRIIGEVKCFQGGHQLSNTFINELLRNSKNFEIVEINSVNIPTKELKSQINKLAINA